MTERDAVLARVREFVNQTVSFVSRDDLRFLVAEVERMEAHIALLEGEGHTGCRERIGVLEREVERLAADGARLTMWELLARPAQTVVFYMGLAHLDRILSRLREQGAPGTRAAAIVEQGTQAAQRVITGTIDDLADKARESRIQSPALLIVGEVTRLHDALHWFHTTAPRGHAFDLPESSDEERLTA